MTTYPYAYEKRRRHLAHIGQPLQVSALGFKRRARALMALGWTAKHIAEELDMDRRNLATMLGSATYVYRATHDSMVTLYERLSMTIPELDVPARRIRNMAERRGWAPPLAWDDIDNPDETPSVTKHAKTVDDVKVERVLNGWLEDCNTAERYAVIERWDGSHKELQRITGWNVHRMLSARKVAA